MGPHEAVRLVSFLLSGAAQLDDGEPEVDQADITATLTLVPQARAEMDELEAGTAGQLGGRSRGVQFGQQKGPRAAEHGGESARVVGGTGLPQYADVARPGRRAAAGPAASPR
ncbi:hypothetical protein [Microbispora catharanthi]|uniref:hypothetical protein n=1 Tax=Microbispora catharanthi TaxID=1712871 RepID=UPI00197CA496|nr:hypothetical protein [Microbispora catharanthi]